MPLAGIESRTTVEAEKRLVDLQLIIAFNIFILYKIKAREMSTPTHESQPSSSSKPAKPQPASQDHESSPRLEGETLLPPVAPNPGVSPTNIRALQATLGNQAVQRIMADKSRRRQPRFNGLPPVPGVPPIKNHEGVASKLIQRNSELSDEQMQRSVQIRYEGESIQEAYRKASIEYLVKLGVPKSVAEEELPAYPGGVTWDKNKPPKVGSTTLITLTKEDHADLFEAARRWHARANGAEGGDLAGTGQDPNGALNGVKGGKQGGKGESSKGSLQGVKGSQGKDPKGSKEGEIGGSREGKEGGVPEGEDEGSDLGSSWGLFNAPLWVHKIIEAVMTAKDIADLAHLAVKLGKKGWRYVKKAFKRVEEHGGPSIHGGGGPHVPHGKGPTDVPEPRVKKPTPGHEEPVKLDEPDAPRGGGKEPGEPHGGGKKPKTEGKQPGTSRPSTPGEFKDLAKEMGYNKRIPPQKAPFNSHGQPVYSNGKDYITPDIGHARHDPRPRGVWKKFDRRGNRVGTYNHDLTVRIGD